MPTTPPWLIDRNFNPEAFFKGAFLAMFVAPWEANMAALADLASVGIVEVSDYAFDVTTKEIEPPGEVWPIDDIITGRKLEVNGNFWEGRLDNLRLAMGLPESSLTTVIPKVAGTTDGEAGLLIGSDDDQISVRYTAAFVHLNQRAQFESGGDYYENTCLDLWKCSFKSKPKLAFKKDDIVHVPFSLTALKDYSITAPETYGYVGRLRAIAPK